MVASLRGFTGCGKSLKGVTVFPEVFVLRDDGMR
jgi:hypothetical protein